MKKSWWFLSFFGMLLLIVGLFWPILDNPLLQWDDQAFVVRWQATKSWNGLPLLLRGDLPPEQSGVYRPVRSFLYLLDYQLWNDNYYAYHAQSLLIHVLIICLIIYLCSKLFNNKWVGLASGLVFAVHPIHVEALAWVTASMDLWGVLFLLISFVLYVFSYKEKHDKKHFFSNSSRLAVGTQTWEKKVFKKLKFLINNYGFSRFFESSGYHPSLKLRTVPVSFYKGDFHYWISIFFAGMAFFTAEQTFVLPLLLIWYDFIFVRKNIVDFFKELWWLRYVPYFGLIGLYWIVRGFILDGVKADAYPFGDVWHTVLFMFQPLVKYFELLIWPVDLGVIHRFKGISSLFWLDYAPGQVSYLPSLSEFNVVSYVLLVAILILFVWFARKKYSVISFGLGWILISLIPVMQIMPRSIIFAQRHVYLASVGWVIVVGVFVSKIYIWLGENIKQKIKNEKDKWRGGMIILVIAFVIYVGWLGYLTRQQIEVWESDNSLWGDAFARDQESFTVLMNRGKAFHLSGDLESAKDIFEKGVEVQPYKDQSWVNLGVVYLQLGEIDEGRFAIEKAIEINERNAEAWNYMGVYWHQQQAYGAAMVDYEKAVELDSEYGEAYNNLGLLYQQLGEERKASEYFERAIELGFEK